MRRPHEQKGRSSLAAVRGHRGKTSSSGDAAQAKLLVAALERGRAKDTRALTHGFHTFPGRMHPEIVRALVAGAPRGGTILDPFCGGGTVLVEAVAAGCTAAGVDASPLAVRLARLKTARWHHDRLRRLVERSRQIAASAAERARLARKDRLPGFDPMLFAPHVYRELYALRERIASEQDPELQEALWLLLSSIVVKVSERRSETRAGRAPTRLAPGFVARVFAAKAEELATGLQELARATPRGTPAARVVEGDSRELDALDLPRPIDVVVSSPPYPGVYDYADHHAVRAAMIPGLDVTAHGAREIGARRDAGRAGARARWQRDLEAVLRGLAERLAPSGRVVLLCGDGVLEGRAVPADESVAAAAKAVGLEVQATAGQDRPVFSAEERRVFRAAKREVLVALSPASPSAGSSARR